MSGAHDGGWEWTKHRRRIMQRDGSMCVWCGTTARLTVDHEVETRHGGTDTPQNLRTLCLTCHRAKTRATDAAAAELVRRHYDEFAGLRDACLNRRGESARSW